MDKFQFEITDPAGLHARPAAQFVQKASCFKSKVKIVGNNKESDAKSIIGVIGMGLKKGTRIIITADGEDEKECLQSLKELCKSNFCER
jgi:phosphocarrier protein HPr